MANLVPWFTNQLIIVVLFGGFCIAFFTIRPLVKLLVNKLQTRRYFHDSMADYGDYGGLDISINSNSTDDSFADISTCDGIDIGSCDSTY